MVQSQVGPSCCGGVVAGERLDFFRPSQKHGGNYSKNVFEPRFPRTSKRFSYAPPGTTTMFPPGTHPDGDPFAAQDEARLANSALGRMQVRASLVVRAY